LKLIAPVLPGFNDRLSALDPGKQGLKPHVSSGSPSAGALSALDPGKQGLKRFEACQRAAWFIGFQRLIQENKD